MTKYVIKIYLKGLERNYWASVAEVCNKHDLETHVKALSEFYKVKVKEITCE